MKKKREEVRHNVASRKITGVPVAGDATRGRGNGRWGGRMGWFRQ